MALESSRQLDMNHAHRHFSASCFNQTWTLIEKPARSERDNEAMVLSAAASLWHWTQRADCSDQNLSIGHWQMSRVYALVGQGGNAMQHAQRSLALAARCSPFYLGYAHEAAARSAAVLGDGALCDVHLKLGTQCATAIVDPIEREPLEQDLLTVATMRTHTL